MRRLLTKGWLLFMLVIVALSVVGLGYTLWNKQQQIEGIINLDDIDVVKVDTYTNDDNVVDEAMWDEDDIGECCWDMDGDTIVGPDECAFTSCDPEGVPDQQGETPRVDKDIGECHAEVDPMSTGEAMVFRVFDGYPSYHCSVRFIDHGLGSVPAALQRIKLNGEVICPSIWYDVDADQNGEVDVNVHVKEPALGTQIDQSSLVDGQVDIDVKQGAPQSKAFSFFVELIWTTWKEFDPGATGCP